MIVIDASVAVKWLVPEPGQEWAQELLTGGQELTAPSLIRMEVAAAVTRKARLGVVPQEDAEAAANLWLQALADGVVSLVSDDVDLPQALKLAFSLKHPLQGRLYLALAERLKATLITADRKFAAAVSLSYPHVRLLYDAAAPDS